jgi:hypothetical protein
VDTPNNPTFWRPRADLIRECVAAGFTKKQIDAACIAEGYEAPSRQAVNSAKQSDGYPIAARPSYYAIVKLLCTEYEKAVRSGKLIVVTQEMKDLIDIGSDCLLQDQIREPTTTKRRKRK